MTSLDTFRSEGFHYQNIHGELSSMQKAWPIESYSFEAGLLPFSLACWSIQSTGGVPNK